MQEKTRKQLADYDIAAAAMVPVSLRMPRLFKQMLEQLADAEHRSFNSELIAILDAYLSGLEELRG